MADKAKPKQQKLGKARSIRLASEDWDTLRTWAAQISAEANVPVNTSQVIRKLIDEEKQRQANSKEVVQAVGTAQ